LKLTVLVYAYFS